MRFISAGAKTGISHLRTANLWSTRTAGRSLPHTAARRRKTALDKPFPLCYLKKQQLRCCFLRASRHFVPGRGHQDRFLLGAIKKNRTDGRWKDAHLTCFLYVHKTAARRFRARLWFGAPSTKREKCVSFRLLPCVRKGRAAFVRRLPFSGFPTLRPGSGHMVEKAAGAFPRPFSIGVEVYVPNHRFPSYLRL